MEGNPVGSYIFRKKDQAVTKDIKLTIKIQDEHVHVDPELLFQRLVAVGTTTKSGELQNVFNYDLCHYPSALFESANVLLPTTKSRLADAQWSSEAAKLPGPGENVRYVLDGGALLHRLPWTRGTTYDQILQHYSSYATRKHSKAIVVFDGYSETPSTKDCAHTRRSGGTIGVTVHFNASMVLQAKKEEFLSNQQN